MEKLIIIMGAILICGIISFGAYQLKKLKNIWKNVKTDDIYRQDAERIVYAYKTEEGYIRQRSRIWLLMIFISAFVIMTYFGSAYYLHNKDVWAAERVEKAQRKALEKEAKEKALVEKAALVKAATETKDKPQNSKAKKEGRVCQGCLIGGIIVGPLMSLLFLILYLCADKRADKERRRANRAEEALEDLKFQYAQQKFEKPAVEEEEPCLDFDMLRRNLKRSVEEEEPCFVVTISKS